MLEIPLGSTAAAAITLGHLVEAAAFLLFAVEVVIERNAGLLRRANERPAQLVDRNQVGHSQRPARAMVLVGQPVVVLGPAEIRQDVAEGPARATFLVLPGVVVGRIAAGIDHRVDRPATTQHPALRVENGAAVHARLGNRSVAPGQWTAGHFEEAHRHVDVGIAVRRAGFDEQHADIRRFAETAGKYATGRAAADDDVVVVHLLTLPPCRRSNVPAGQAGHAQTSVQCIPRCRNGRFPDRCPIA
ncbi:hypothetical protein D3C78_1189480 [compost metagenome]